MAKATKLSMKERMAQRREDLNRRSNGSTGMFFPKEGETRFRLLNVGEETEFITEVPYYYLGQGVGGHISREAIGEECPTANLRKGIETLIKDDNIDESTKEDLTSYLEKLKNKKKNLALGFVYEDTRGKKIDSENAPTMMVFGVNAAAQIIDYYLNPEWGEEITDPENGYDLIIKRTGKGLDTEYNVQPCKNTAISDKDLRGEFDLEEAIKGAVKSPDKIEEMLEKAFPGLASEVESMLAGGSSSKPKKKKKVRKSSDV